MFGVGLIMLAAELAAWVVALTSRGWTRRMFGKPKAQPTPTPGPQPLRPSPMQGESGRGNGSKKK